MTVQVRAELEAAGRLASSLGALALTLAERLDASAGVAGVAPLVRELRATMDEIRASAPRAGRLAELRAARR